MTQAEIGVAIGISQMQVSRILRQTIAQLREAAEAPAQPEPEPVPALT
jgi:RNA polymerase sigma-B factor